MKRNSTIQTVRIAQIIGKMLAGGVETVVFNYYRMLDHDKYQFDFYYDADSTVEPPEDLIKMGARFIKLPPYQKIHEYIRELRKCFRMEHYSIVHSHLNTISVFPLYAAWRENIPVRIAHNHSVPGGHEGTRGILKRVLKRFAKIFPTDYAACSEKAGRWLFGNREYDAGNVTILKNAIDMGKFMMPKKTAYARRSALGLTNKFVVGGVGRFTYQKNIPFLINVFSIIKERKENAVLLLVGDGEEREMIEEEVHKRKLDDEVIMTGSVSDPENYYGLCNVVVVPSLFEGFSLVTLESQAAHIPVVVSKVVPKEAIISNGCKYLDVNDPPRVWANNAIEMSERTVVLSDEAKQYDIFTQTVKLEEWYTSVIKKRV